MLAPVLLYLVIMFAYIAIRPKITFYEDGSLKSFGVGEHKTMFPLWIVALLSAVLVSFLYSLVTI